MEATIKVNDQVITFKLDTGAEVTAITEPTFLQLNYIRIPTITTKPLHGPDKQPLQVLGQVTLTFCQRGRPAHTMPLWSEILSRIC